MRELVFDIEYEPGGNTVADTLAEYPEARIRSLSLHATTESLWRVDGVVEAALEPRPETVIVRYEPGQTSAPAVVAAIERPASKSDPNATPSRTGRRSGGCRCGDRPR